MTISFKRAAASALALSLGLGLAACGGNGPHNASLYSIKQPVVERTNYMLDVSAGTSGLTVPEQQRVRAGRGIDVERTDGDVLDIFHGAGRRHGGADDERIGRGVALGISTGRQGGGRSDGSKKKLVHKINPHRLRQALLLGILVRFPEQVANPACDTKASWDASGAPVFLEKRRS